MVNVFMTRKVGWLVSSFPLWGEMYFGLLFFKLGKCDVDNNKKVRKAIALEREYHKRKNNRKHTTHHTS